MDLLQLLAYLINGGGAIALACAALKLESRITKLETDTSWLKGICERRSTERKTKS